MTLLNLHHYMDSMHEVIAKDIKVVILRMS